MNALIDSLNELSQPGDWLRFVFSKNPENEICFDIEGGSEEAAALFARVSALLQIHRSFGIEFQNLSAKNDSEHEHVPISWLSVRPQSQEFSPGTSARLGFGSDLEQSYVPIVAPAFSITQGRELAQSPLMVPFTDRAVSRVEIEFVRWELADSSRPMLQQLLDCGEENTEWSAWERSSPTRRFFELWLLHGIGWEISLRVGLKEKADSQVLALVGLAGQQFFRTPCRVEASDQSETIDSLASEKIDLAFRFPVGWGWPDIFPGTDDFGRIHGRRKYQAVAPRLPRQGIHIGRVDDSEVRLPDATRDRHTYVIGATGTGKSTLLKRLICEDMRAGQSVVLLDPHGDLYNEILREVPENRLSELFIIDPRNPANPPAYNFLKIPRDGFFRRRAEFLIGELLHFFYEQWAGAPVFGPMFEMYFRNILLLLLLGDPSTKRDRKPSPQSALRASSGETKEPAETPPITLMSFERVLTDEEFRKQLLRNVTDEPLKRFWEEMATKVERDASLNNIAPYITSKINVFTGGGFLTEMISQNDDAVRLEERMDQGCIFLVNLDKGILGADASRLLGSMLTMQLFAAGLKRSGQRRDERRPVNIYIDEFQNFVSDHSASMLSEARKFGLRLHLANQTLSQLSSPSRHENILDSVLGNVGNLIFFRLGVTDAERLQAHFTPFTSRQMIELKNYHALARLLTDEGPLQPFIFETLP